MPWPGLILLGLLVLLFMTLSKERNRPGGRTFIVDSSDLANQIFEALQSEGFSFFMSQAITCQSAFETKDFQSQLVRDNNNYFGMRDGSGRSNKQAGLDKYGYAVYKSLDDSVTDYRLYYQDQNYSQAYSSLESFVKDLAEHKYFQSDPGLYLGGMNAKFQKYFSK